MLGGLGDLAEQVAGDEHSTPASRLIAKQVAQPAHPLRVEPVGGLVEDEDARLAKQGSGQRQALAHSQRVALDPALGGAGQLDHLQHLLDPRVGDPRRCGEGAEVVAAAAAGVEGGRLQCRADRAQRVAHRHRRLAVDQGGPAARPQQPEQGPHRRRLPRPVGAEETGDEPGLDREREVVDGHGPPVALGQVSNLELRHRGAEVNQTVPGVAVGGALRPPFFSFTADSSSSVVKPPTASPSSA